MEAPNTNTSTGMDLKPVRITRTSGLQVQCLNYKALFASARESSKFFLFDKSSKMAERNICFTNATQWMPSDNAVLLVRGSSSARHRGHWSIEQLVQSISLERTEERQRDYTAFLCKDKQDRNNTMASGQILHL